MTTMPPRPNVRQDTRDFLHYYAQRKQAQELRDAERKLLDQVEMGSPPWDVLVYFVVAVCLWIVVATWIFG
jgi:hypothetical protein